MRLRAIIIDDEETAIETLRLLIEKYIDDVKVVAEFTRTSDAIQKIEDFKPEIVFLDISMPELDGFELLERLEWKNFNLFFTTAHKEYALKALKQNAIDYLLKPIDHRDLRLAVNKVNSLKLMEKDHLAKFDFSSIEHAIEQATNKLGLNSREGIEFVDPTEIISLESSSNYTKVLLHDSRSILSPKTLGDFESQLCNEQFKFMRVHHSFVINLRKVARYLKEEEDIVMVNNQVIPLAKSRRENFFKWLHTLGV